MKVSVVIPVYNALRFAQECVASIYDAGSELEFEVIVMDNGSAADVGDWLEEEARRRPNLRPLRDEEPLGFARAVNRGAAAARGEVLILLNSDTYVTAGWMEGLCGALAADPALGIVTPVTNHAGERLQMDIRTIDLSRRKAVAYFQGNPRPREVVAVSQVLTFFCAAMRREVWEEAGGLDEGYAIGNYEDDDLCLRLRQAGYRLGVARSVFVYHHNNVTFHANGIDHTTAMGRNVAVFAGKARGVAEAAPREPRWPRRSGGEIAVVIAPRPEFGMEATLRSLANQTLAGFDIVLPGERVRAGRRWVATVRQGDILYPFHLETLRDELERQGGDAIVSCGWNEAGGAVWSPPAGVAGCAGGIAGSMMDGSLEGNWDEAGLVLVWRRMTWELRGDLPEAGPAVEKREALPLALARTIYRRLVPYERRLALDASVRRVFGIPTPAPDRPVMERLTVELEEKLAGLESRGRECGPKMPVFLFNIISWGAAVQRPHHFARGLGKAGHPVFWVDTAFRSPRSWFRDRKLEEIAPEVRMVQLPSADQEIYRAQWSEAAVEAAAAAVLLTAGQNGIREAVSVVNYPGWRPLVEKLRERAGWPVIYDCLDDQKAFAELYQTPHSSHEEWLLTAADAVFTSSRVLQERFRERRCTLLPNGADVELFSNAEPTGRLQALPRPIAGFFGALADWLDMDLIHAAAQRYPEWSFVYIGPEVFATEEGGKRWRQATNLPNIHVLGQMEQRPLASCLAAFDICTMPFLDIPVTRTMNAVKIYEYLAAGKAVVARDLPETRYLDGSEGLVRIYGTAEEYFRALEGAAGERDAGEVARRKAFARENDWGRRVEVLSGEIGALYRMRSRSPSSSSRQT